MKEITARKVSWPVDQIEIPPFRSSKFRGGFSMLFMQKIPSIFLIANLKDGISAILLRK